ncbi:MAG: AAA family ATPase [bacterium]
MDYTTLLNLKKEPFSISPDPSFFYYSRDYQECLQQLELSIRLRRGLNIILGDVGTGKTTLSRALIQLFQGYEEFRFHLILDPSFNSEYEFLLSLVKIFNIPVPEEKTSLAFKEAIRTNLLKEGLERKRVIVLIIDETQKMDYPFLELLRDFLNFETNEYKLLQLVLFGQMEFLDKIQGKKNFMDRVNMLYFLKPLSLADTREMIDFRLRKAGYFSRQSLFTQEAYQKIYECSQGYPRKIVNLCHHCLLLMLIRKQQVVDKQIVELVVKSLFPDAVFPEQRKFNLKKLSKLAAPAAALAVLVILGFFGIIRHRSATDTGQEQATSSRKAGPSGLSPVQSPQTGSVPQPGSLHTARARSQAVPSDARSDSNPVGQNDLPPVDEPIRKADNKNFPADHRNLPEDSAPGEIQRAGYQVVVAGKGDFVSRMALKLYGCEKVTDSILASIHKANPHISNLNLIEPGQKVYFPDLTADGGKSEKGSRIYGVQVDSFPTVDQAQGCLNKLSSIGRRIYIERENLSDQRERYSVIVGPFTDLTRAWETMDKLEKKDFNNSRVIVISQD